MKRPLLALLIAISLQASAQTPVMVYDLDPGAGSGEPWMTSVFNNKLYFSGRDPATGRELWVYDGMSNPSMVYNLNPGAASAMIGGSNSKVAELNGKIYFAADNGTSGVELVTYDGINPPALAHDIDPGSGSSNPGVLTTIGNKIYFQATIIANSELYVFDGVNPPVQYEINPGVQGSSPVGFTPLNNKVYFVANNATVGSELFVYDPGNNMVTMAEDIETGPTSSSPMSPILFNGLIYFTANSTAYGRELYSFNGTAATRLTDMNVGALNSITGNIVAYSNQIYFSGTLGGGSYQLYKYNPSNSTTALVYSIYPLNNSQIDNFTIYNNKLYFKASNAASGSELWVHDGTSTTMVADINPGATNSNIRDLQVYNNKLYFTADNGTNGYELYSLTDTALSIQNTKMNGDVAIRPNPTSSNAILEVSLHVTATVNISVTDVTGKLIWENSSINCQQGKTDISIPISKEPAGMYFYRLTDTRGTLMASGRIIKQ